MRQKQVRINVHVGLMLKLTSAGKADRFFYKVGIFKFSSKVPKLGTVILLS